MPSSYQKAHFRYIATECCGTQLCWVNPRLPNYCPECGKHIYPAVKSWTTFQDFNATIRIKNENGKGVTA